MTDLVKIGVEADSKKLVAAAKSGDKALDQLGDQAKITGRDLDGMGQEAAAVERKIDRVAKASDTAARATRRLGAGAISIQTTGKAALWASEKIVNRYTAMGAGFTVAAAGMASAQLDKRLNNIRQTAGATREQADQLRTDLFRLGAETGQPIEQLSEGFNNLVQSGQSWDAARQEIAATAKAMAVTGADAGVLTSALTVAGEAFQFDLSKPGMALTILDKMLVAGRLGNAELENLSDIFARIGVNAKSAGMDIDQSLAFIETLSYTEKNPERLATLADSTLRLFNNLNYMRDASKATGVKFFDAKGTRREAVAVLADLQKQYKKLGTDKERALWFGKAFGKTDQDTVKGLRILLGGDSLSRGVDFAGKISGAGGAIEKDLPDAVGNLIDQFGRLTAVVREGTEGTIRPLIKGLTGLVGFFADNKDLTKYALYGGAGAVASAGAVVAAGTVIKNWRELQGILGWGGSKGSKGPLETVLGASGAQRVYVVNWPGGALGGLGGAGGFPGVPGGARGRWGRWAVGGGALALGAGMALAEDGISGRSGARIAGTALGLAVGGPIGAMVGSMAAEAIIDGLAEAEQKSKEVARQKAEAFLTQIDQGRMAFSRSASDATRMPPITLNLTNQVDAQGRTTATVSGPGASQVQLKSQVIAPTWAQGDR